MIRSHIPCRGFTLPLVVVCLMTGTVKNSHATPPSFSWEDCGGEKLWLKERGETVMMFQLKPTSFDGEFARANYVHPLVGPNAMVVTEDFPQDHRHHRGIFWAWHQVLLDGKSLADAWVCRDIQWKPPEESGDWVKTRADSQAAAMTVVRDWVVPHPDGNGQTLRLVRETVGITVWPSSQELRIVDFDLRFRALLEGVSLGGSDDAKGYGGFSPRIRLADDVKFVGQRGELAPQRMAAVDGGAWVDVTGTLDNVKGGVAMMVHPSHPGFPLPWILRARGSMQNPRWPGRQPVDVGTRTDTRLRYRLVLHSRELDHEELESLWRQYADDADR